MIETLWHGVAALGWAAVAHWAVSGGIGLAVGWFCKGCWVKWRAKWKQLRNS